MHRLQNIKAREAAKAEAKRRKKMQAEQSARKNTVANTLGKIMQQRGDDSEMPHYKRVRMAVEELRLDLREKVKDKIDTVIKFEIEHAKKPKEQDKDKDQESDEGAKLLQLEEPEDAFAEDDYYMEDESVVLTEQDEEQDKL